jgi:hypothetical protein
VAPGESIGRDLVLEAGTIGKRLRCSEGAANLGQQLASALTTRLGDSVFDTGYGFDGLRALAEETSPLLQRGRIRVAIIQVLTRDPRVRRIIDVRLDQGDGNSVLSSDTGARDLSVRVEFEAVTGETSAVTIDGLLAASVAR